MKVHFIGDLTGEKTVYNKICRLMEKLGYTIITNHSIVRTIEDVEKETEEGSMLYAKQMIKWVREADIVVVEATKSMLGAGFEIATALNLEKSVIVLYKLDYKNTPHVLKGIQSEKLQVISYVDETLEKVLKPALGWASDQQNTRFTMLLDPEIVHFLDEASQQKRISKSEYIRDLIRKDSTKNK